MRKEILKEVIVSFQRRELLKVVEGNKKLLLSKGEIGRENTSCRRMIREEG